MSDNVYAAPNANFDEPSHSGVDDRFYVVSTRKMLTLFFLTFGLYHLYWNFRNWQLHKLATGEDLWPLPRALFAILFTRTLYREIAAYDSTGNWRDWDCETYANGMVFLMFAGYALSWGGKSSTFLTVVSILLLLPIGILLKQAQAEVNARCGDPEGSSNDTFTVANIIWCTLGGVIWFLFAVGMLLIP
ncbi:hypothetical protein [Duganella sp. Root1480D1]|uniref:hypothetical protein n=1 Tax=Duganella sp. Root1480D1 TaxID=1736471 RepID=UPI000712C654|nr:hypothetical protein [Duganella sp. Root1480D1]KQZ30472.1 hypothetical protein ASD58_10710 [Duganella sp. Root1480D1]